MSETVRIPDPVYEQVTQEAERRDVSRGAVIEDWMDKAEKYERMDQRYNS